MRVVFSSDDLPEADRLAGYREVLSRADVPVDVHAEPEEPIRVRMSTMDLGAIEVAAIAATDNARVRIDRPQRLVRRSDPDAFRLMVAQHGSIAMTQGDRTPRLTAAHMSFYDTSRPFRGWRQADDGRFHVTMMTVPRALLPMPANLVKAMIGVPIDGRRGVGALMVDVVNRLLTDSAHWAQVDAGRLATVVVDLMAALLGHELGAEPTRTASPEFRHRMLRTRIHSFIHDHLHDPDLTPRTIAAAHHISVRLLHQLFRDEGGTVAATIRGARLERCRADLAEPLCSPWTIRQIAARRGFPNYSHFSSLFQATYGISPRAWRARPRP
ncbi:helix-turn-helix domain-containing protein [Actinoplanes sp. NBRC 101535]|uniref:AraC-like ligand-binding domain-containing protein n=1 Tax=Actinoplanes sp. NBRC 101535 TaxID=3032196 RepID=UPI0024A5742F|nr:helix-turn-helix domain-containing protein [Actinoplanes sp. NBRC 101535]GLY07868.1 AraC family transcriptional regulator [Actinoplanes sp. NBRC 101535]